MTATTRNSNTDERPSTSDHETGNVQLVGFRLAGEQYAIEIDKVREIILPIKCTRLPNAPKYILGLINLRGEVMPLVDPRRRLELPDAEWTDETRVVIVDVGGKQSGVLVDSVTEVLRVGVDRIVSPPSAVVGPEREYLTGLVQLDDRLLILLDISAVLGAEEKVVETAAVV